MGSQHPGLEFGLALGDDIQPWNPEIGYLPTTHIEGEGGGSRRNAKEPHSTFALHGGIVI